MQVNEHVFASPRWRWGNLDKVEIRDADIEPLMGLRRRGRFSIHDCLRWKLYDYFAILIYRSLTDFLQWPQYHSSSQQSRRVS